MATLKVTNIKNESFAGDQLYLKTDGTIGIGTTSPEDLLHIKTGKIRIENAIVSNNDSTISYDNDTFLVDVDPNNVRGSSKFQIKVDTVAGLTVDDNRRVGIGTTSPTAELEIFHATDPEIHLNINTHGDVGKILGDADGLTLTGNGSSNQIRFKTNDQHRMRIDSSGRLLVGHSVSDPMFYTGRIQVQGTSSSTSAITIKTNQNDSGGPALVLGKSRGSIGTQTIVQSGDELGAIYWNGADGTDTNSYASGIRCNVDGTPGSNDMPGRLVFLTTADGASTSTERLRITSNGQIFVSNEAGTIDTTARLGEGNRFQLSGLSSNDGFSVVRYSTSYGPWGFNMGRSKSGTLGTNTIVQNHNDLGHITFWGADGTDFNQACQISGVVDGTPSDGADMPGRLVFKTTSEGSGTPTERYRISADGTHTWGYPMVFAYTPGTTQSLTDSTWTKNTWLTSEDIDTDSAFASSTFTVPAGKGGKYFIAASNNLYGNDNNIRAARTAIYKNGSIYARSYNMVMSTSSSGLRHFSAVQQCIATLAAGDTIEQYMNCDVESGLVYMSSDTWGARGNYLLIYRIG